MKALNTAIIVASIGIAGALIYLIIGMSPLNENRLTSTPIEEVMQEGRSGYPLLNMELHSIINHNDSEIRIIHYVTYDETKALYQYRYKFLAEENTVLTWEILDRLQDLPGPALLSLKANVHQTIEIVSENEPVFEYGEMSIYELKEIKGCTYLAPIPIKAQPAPVPVS